MEELSIRRGPGRPPKAEPEILAPGRASNRKPFGVMDQKLAYEQRAGFHRHWFNDAGNRVVRAEEAGYKHVLGKDEKPVSKVVGTAEGGSPLTAFLMEIPEEWYQEDMAAQQKIVNEREDAMRRGKLDDQLGDKGYVPAQGISIKRG